MMEMKKSNVGICTCALRGGYQRGLINGAPSSRHSALSYNMAGNKSNATLQVVFLYSSLMWNDSALVH